MLKYKQLKLRVTQVPNYSNEKDERFMDFSRNWKAYEGTQPISEARFFELTGDNEKAEIVNNSVDNSGNNIGIGIVLTITGVLFAAIGLLVNTGDDSNDGGSDTRPGTVMAAVGAGAAGIGLGMASSELKSPLCTYSYQVAETAAANYNERLLMKITRDYQDPLSSEKNAEIPNETDSGDRLEVEPAKLESSN